MPHFGRASPPLLFFSRKVEVLKGVKYYHLALLFTAQLSLSLSLFLCTVVAMFDTTMEFITQATSNSLFVFCFCNLIIAILLIGSLKPSSCSDQETAIPFSVVTNVDENDKGTENAEDLFKESRASMDAHEVSDTEKEVTEEHNKEDDYDASSLKEEDKKEDDDDDDDELRRKVEEFIEKINRGWRAEMMRTVSLVQTENLQTRGRKIHAM